MHAAGPEHAEQMQDDQQQGRVCRKFVDFLERVPAFALLAVFIVVVVLFHRPSRQ